MGLTSNSIDCLCYDVPVDQEYASFPLEAHVLDNFDDFEGWAWYRVSSVSSVGGGFGNAVSELMLDRLTWIESVPISSLAELESGRQTHLLLLRCKSDRDRIICIYPVSSESGTSSITKSTDSNNLLLGARRVTAKGVGRVACIVATSDDPSKIHALLADSVSRARQWLSGDQAGTPFSSPPPGPLDGVGFCTWSSIGEDIRLDRKNLSDLVDKLASSQIPIQTFIIDDGWLNYRVFGQGKADVICKTGPSELTGTWRLRGLWDFDSWSGFGNGGLRDVVRSVKGELDKAPGVGEVNVGAWLALTGGYWEGIHPESPLVSKYNCRPYKISRARIPAIPNEAFTVGFIPSTLQHYYLPPPEESYRFFRDWFSFLASSGITFVKVDNQAGLCLLDGVDGAECQMAMFSNVVRAANEVFGANRVIHCMAQHESMWGGPQGLGQVTGNTKFTWRNSDDFGLVGKKSNPHQQHVYTNLFNAMLTSHLSMILDADMFMTSAQYPIANALLRALFPGPLMLSDRPGHTDASLLNRLIARDTRGIFRVVHTETAAKVLARRVFDLTINSTGPGTAIFASVLSGEVAMIGAWNTRDDEDKAPVLDSLSLRDIEDALNSPQGLEGSWAICDMDISQGGVKSTVVVDRTHSETVLFPVTIPVGEAASYWVAPLHPLGALHVAFLGLIDQLAGATAISKPEVAEHICTFTVRYQGTIGIIVIGDYTTLSITVNGRVVERSATRLSNSKVQVPSKVYLIEFPLSGSATSGREEWEVVVQPTQ